MAKIFPITTKLQDFGLMFPGNRKIGIFAVLRTFRSIIFNYCKKKGYSHSDNNKKVSLLRVTLLHKLFCVLSVRFLYFLLSFSFFHWKGLSSPGRWRKFCKFGRLMIIRIASPWSDRTVFLFAESLTRPKSSMLSLQDFFTDSSMESGALRSWHRETTRRSVYLFPTWRRRWWDSKSAKCQGCYHINLDVVNDLHAFGTWRGRGSEWPSNSVGV